MSMSFMFNSCSIRCKAYTIFPNFKGRAGLVALRRYRSGATGIGKGFYKGGFEQLMNKREASLILALKYVSAYFSHQYVNITY